MCKKSQPCSLLNTHGRNISVIRSRSSRMFGIVVFLIYSYEK